MSLNTIFINQSINQSINKFIHWRKIRALPPSKSRTFNLLYHDPKTVTPEEYRFDIACELKNTSLNTLDKASGIVCDEIPEGRYAKIRYQGDDALLEHPIHYLYQVWLPKSDVVLRGMPLFIERLRFFPDVAAQEAVSDIYLAIE